jgi:ubiquinone/menaquinone biosynthesis C-methylase UbiE
VAKKRTKSFSNVDYRVGEISSLDIDDKSYDMVVVSFVLHDVEEQKRSVIVNELARRLKPGGRIVIKEPTKSDHGMEPSDIRMLMSGAGLKEEESKSLKSRFDAIYRK